MFKNKVFLFGLVFLVLVLSAAFFFTFREQISNQVSKLQTTKPSDAQNSQQKISIVDGSGVVDFKVDMDFVYKIYEEEVVAKTNETVLKGFEPVTIQFTDNKQDNSYGWQEDKHYESITIRKTAPTGKEVFINIVPEVMRENGWDEKNIQQEIEQLIILALITQPDLYMTSDSLEQKRTDAFNVFEKYDFQGFVTLQ